MNETTNKGGQKVKTKELKKLIQQYKQEAEAEIFKLDKNASEAGSCWESEKLGFAKGYFQALTEILAKI